MNEPMPKKSPKPEPIVLKPHSFNLPTTLLGEVEAQARKEAKGARPNMSGFARRALQNELKRCKVLSR